MLHSKYFNMNIYQLQVYDLFHGNNSISVTTPCNKYHGYNLITYLAYMYHYQRIVILADSIFTAHELKLNFKSLINWNKNHNVKIYGIQGLRNFEIDQVDIVIIVNYNYCKLSNRHKSILEQLSNYEKTKLMMISTYNNGTKDIIPEMFLPSNCLYVDI